MTTEELERDLRALAEPRESDESLRWATRARLGEQMLERPRGGRRGLRIATGAATAAAAAAAVIGVALLGGPGGSAGPSTADAEIVHHALRGLTEPASMIVHVKEDGVQNGTPVSVEWWQETSPPYALRMIKGWDGRLYEGAADGTTRFQYDADTNTILKTTGAKSPTRPVDDPRRDVVQDRTVNRRDRILQRHHLPPGVSRQPKGRRQHRSNASRDLRGTADDIPDGAAFQPHRATPRCSHPYAHGSQQVGTPGVRLRSP
jgi:hypothetical protein